MDKITSLAEFDLIREKLIYDFDTAENKGQKQTLSGNETAIKNINDYLIHDGYKAFTKALRKEPQAIINEIKKSGLQEKGFPLSGEWEATRNHVKKFTKYNNSGINGYIICKSAENDTPEINPYSIIEGMLIGAYAMAINNGIIYLSEKNSLTLKNTSLAIEDAANYGLLGQNILNYGLDFNLKIIQTKKTSTFISAIEIALLAFVEHKTGATIPEGKLPYPHEWEMPVCLSNSNTWASIPAIINPS